MQQAIAGLATSYYLVFGREMNRDGELEKVWIELELPHKEDFCHWEDGTLSHLKFMVELRANEAKGSSASTIFPIFTAMMNAMDYMEGRIDQLVDCCGSAGRESCECGWSFEEVREYSIGMNFYEIQSNVYPVNNQIDTNCICWNDVSLNQELYSLDSGTIYRSVTFDSLVFNNQFDFDISGLFQILKDIGVRTNERRQTFFGAITDQYVFCDQGSPPSAARTMTLSPDEIHYELAQVDLGIWFNVLHFNGTATVSILSKGLTKGELSSVFSTECLDKSTFAECAFIRLAYFYHNSPLDLPADLFEILSDLAPIDVYSLFNHYRRSDFNPQYINWFVQTTLMLDSTDTGDMENAETFEPQEFDGPVINDDHPACAELIEWANIQPDPGFGMADQKGAVIFKIAIELSIPESLDGPKIYTGGYWRFNASRRELPFPFPAKDSLSSITAQAINQARNTIVEFIIENDGEFPVFLEEIDEDLYALHHITIWENTHLWGVPISQEIKRISSQMINGPWLNNLVGNRRGNFNIMLTHYNPLGSWPTLSVVNFPNEFLLICD